MFSRKLISEGIRRTFSTYQQSKDDDDVSSIIIYPPELPRGMREIIEQADQLGVVRQPGVPRHVFLLHPAGSSHGRVCKDVLGAEQGGKGARHDVDRVPG